MRLCNVARRPLRAVLHLSSLDPPSIASSLRNMCARGSEYLYSAQGDAPWLSDAILRQASVVELVLSLGYLGFGIFVSSILLQSDLLPRWLGPIHLIRLLLLRPGDP